MMATPQEVWMMQARAMKEAELQASIQNLAAFLKWRWYHPADSNRVVPGFPDLTMVKPPRLVFAELKQQARHPEPEQREWHEELAAAGAEVYVWKPYDYLSGRVQAVLQGVPYQEPLPVTVRARG